MVSLQIDLMMDNLVSDHGTAAVVDGGRVLITPLQRALIPPPMCAAAADFPGPVQCCAFGEHQGTQVCLLQASCLPTGFNMMRQDFADDVCAAVKRYTLLSCSSLRLSSNFAPSQCCFAYRCSVTPVTCYLTAVHLNNCPHTSVPLLHMRA